MDCSDVFLSIKPEDDGNTQFAPEEIRIKGEPSSPSSETDEESKHDSTTTAGQHLEDHHHTPPEEEFDCKLCFFRTKISKAFEKHIRMKHAGGMFQCQHCDYTTAQSRNLKFHSRKHTG